ncbi:MAG: hypothetical protein AB1665_09000 [Candidatus Thermoplasmatota archaeon]
MRRDFSIYHPRVSAVTHRVQRGTSRRNVKAISHSSEARTHTNRIGGPSDCKGYYYRGRCRHVEVAERMGWRVR